MHQKNHQRHLIIKTGREQALFIVCVAA